METDDVMIAMHGAKVDDRRRDLARGHSVDPDWLWVVQWLLGVMGVAFAMIIGLFVFFGGAESLTTPQYVNMMLAFHDYRIIGAIMIIGSLMGVAGLGLNRRWLSIWSAVVCGTWNGLLAGYTVPANWATPGGGNLIGLYALFVTLLYFSRIILLCKRPGPLAIKPR